MRTAADLPRYPVVGFSFSPSVAGPVYLQMTLYEFLYTGIGQFIAAYAPNAVFAALVNPLLIAGKHAISSTLHGDRADVRSVGDFLWCLGPVRADHCFLA